MGLDSEERRLLIEAMLMPYNDSPDTRQSYMRYVATAKWVAESLASRPMTAEELIFENYYHVCMNSQANLTPVELSWAEYDLRRRVHFACELILADTTHTLMDLTSGTVESVVEHWMSLDDISTSVREVTALDKLPPSVTLGGFIEALPGNSFLDSQLRVQEGREAPAGGNQALYGLALLCASYKQSQILRESGRISDRRHYVERAFELLDRLTAAPLSTALRDIALYLAVEPHLGTTLRKMGQGQRCSLRFFPEGHTLRPTGVGVTPGLSGSRLRNVLMTLSDVGLLKHQAGGLFDITDEGRSRLLRGES
jgi:hypothetical protein